MNFRRFVPRDIFDIGLAGSFYAIASAGIVYGVKNAQPEYILGGAIGLGLTTLLAAGLGYLDNSLREKENK